MNYYSKWCFFRGYICTCNDDDTIPLNSLVVLDLTLLAHQESSAIRIVAMHNEMRYKLRSLETVKERA